MVLCPKEKVPYPTWYFFPVVLFPSIRNNNVEVVGTVNIVDIMYIELCVCSVYSV